MSWELIMPFLKPIEALIRDPGISDILVNPSGQVFVERDGLLIEVKGIEIRQKQLQVAVRQIARSLGNDVSESRPILDARLPDGSRVASVFEPCSVGGTTLAIRKFNNKRFDLEELVRIGTLTSETADLLKAAVRDHKNILISGGTGTGKTTLLNALAASIPPDERIVIIEDTADKADLPKAVETVLKQKDDSDNKFEGIGQVLADAKFLDDKSKLEIPIFEKILKDLDNKKTTLETVN